MTNEEINTLADKIKMNTATEEEKIIFQKELNKLLSEMKETLE